MTKISTKDRALFIKTYDNCVANTIERFNDYKKTMLETLDGHNFETDFCFEEFAKQAFLHNLKSWHDKNHAMETVLQQAKDILNQDIDG